MINCFKQNFCKCFHGCRESSSYRNYIALIGKYKKNTDFSCILERHHVIPFAFYRENGISVDEDSDNLVYLPVRQRLKAMFLLLKYFRELRELEIAVRVAKYISNMTGLNYIKIMELQDFSPDQYEIYYKERVSEIEKSGKLTIPYLRKCFETYSMFNDHKTAFEEVQRKYDYPLQRITLVRWFARLFGDEFEIVRKRMNSTKEIELQN